MNTPKKRHRKVNMRKIFAMVMASIMFLSTVASTVFVVLK